LAPNRGRINMASRRPGIPRPVRDQVLAEFNHRCAICGGERPHVHHIDGDPSNNDPSNLIPLCPNCHLTDQHNPTTPVDPAKLAMFRRFKDPTILSAEFEPLYARLRFLDNVDGATDFEASIRELISFVRALTMGQFYGDRLASMLKMPRNFALLYLEGSEYQQRKAEHQQDCRRVLIGGRDEVRRLAVELLRYQPWSKSNRTNSG
jgi:hypothetical protein